jgi:hypothetical protein
MDPTKEQHQILCQRKGATETLAMIRQEAFKEESISHTRIFEWH